MDVRDSTGVLSSGDSSSDSEDDVVTPSESRNDVVKETNDMKESQTGEVWIFQDY